MTSFLRFVHHTREVTSSICTSDDVHGTLVVVLGPDVIVIGITGKI
jgi:hypothetical protein